MAICGLCSAPCYGVSGTSQVQLSGRLPLFDAMYSASVDPTSAGTNENAISATLVVAVLIS